MADSEMIVRIMSFVSILKLFVWHMALFHRYDINRNRKRGWEVIGTDYQELKEWLVVSLLFNVVSLTLLLV